MEQLYDYELEEWIRSQSEPRRTSARKTLSWRQRTQYAVGHAINDYLTLPPDMRSFTPASVILERRWPKRRDSFDDELHYWKVFATVAEQLKELFVGDLFTGYPVALYEQWNSYVSQLDLNLSMIFQVVWENQSSSGKHTVQKFMVDEDAEVMRTFVHLSNVFWHAVYKRPVDNIEIYMLMSGKKHCFSGEMISQRESLDYVYLLSETVKAERAAQSECSCGDSLETPRILI